MKTILIIIIFFASFALIAQDIRKEVYFGESTLASQQGITSIRKNIAGLTVIDSRKWKINFSNSFSISELWKASISYIPKIKTRGNLPITISCRGPGNFFNTNVKVGYAQQFSNHFSAGVRILSEYYFIKHSNNMFNAGFEIGTIYSINKKAKLGLVCAMPNLLNNTTENRWKNISIETAFSYYLFDKASINFSIRKEQSTNIEFIANIVSQLTKNSYIFLAYNSESKQVGAGVTMNFKKCNIAAIAEINFQVGVSTEIQIVF